MSNPHDETSVENGNSNLLPLNLDASQRTLNAKVKRCINHTLVPLPYLLWNRNPYLGWLASSLSGFTSPMTVISFGVTSHVCSYITFCTTLDTYCCLFSCRSLASSRTVSFCTNLIAKSVQGH